jgi:hypothetical protein
MAEERGPEVGRLALRQEGGNWVAYYAPTGTMLDAIFLGAICMVFVVDHPERKEAFIGLMREAVGDLIEQATGVRPVWGAPQPAPEHERSGNG